MPSTRASAGCLLIMMIMSCLFCPGECLQCAGLTQLTVLEVSVGFPDPTCDLSPLSALTGLRSLTLERAWVVAGLGTVAACCRELRTLRLISCSFPQGDEDSGSAVETTSNMQPKDPALWASLQQLSFKHMSPPDMLVLLQLGSGLPAAVHISVHGVIIPSEYTQQQLGVWAEALGSREAADIATMDLSCRDPADTGILAGLSPLAGHVRKIAVKFMRLRPGAVAALAGALPELISLDLRLCDPCTASAMEAVMGLQGLTQLGLPWPEEGEHAEELAAGYAAACAAAQSCRAGTPSGPTLTTFFDLQESAEAVEGAWEDMGRADKGLLKVRLQSIDVWQGL